MTSSELMRRIGGLAVCAQGRLGVVTGKKRSTWTGHGLLDGQPWQSKAPRFLAEDEVDRMAALLELAAQGAARD